MNETVTGFTCRNGEACYFCGRLKGELHEHNCSWITDLKIRNIVSEANIATKDALEAKKDLHETQSYYRNEHQRTERNRRHLSKKNDELLNAYGRVVNANIEMKRHLKILEAFLDTLVK